MTPDRERDDRPGARKRSQGDGQERAKSRHWHHRFSSCLQGLLNSFITARVLSDARLYLSAMLAKEMTDGKKKLDCFGC